MRSHTPVTYSLMAALTVFVFLIYAHIPASQYLEFYSGNFPLRFWTPFTWPVAPSMWEIGPFGLIFALGWAYTFGGSVERSWGTRDYAKFMVATSVLTAVSIWVGSFLLHTPTGVSGLLVAMAPVVVVWSVINAREVVTFFFLPIPGPVWGVIGAAVAYVDAGAGLIGLFALPACAAAYWYARFGRYGYSGYSKNPNTPFGGLRSGGFDGGNASGRGSDRNSRFQNFDQEGLPNRRRGLRDFNVFRWWRDRQERKRLEEIFRRSGLTEEEDDSAGEKRRPR